MAPIVKPTPTPSTFIAPKRTKWRKIVEAMDDRFDILQRSQKAIEKVRGAALPESLDAYLAQSLYDTRTAAALEKFQHDEVAGIVKGMKTGKVSMDDLGIYLMAKHAPERNALMAQRDPAWFAAGGGSGLTDKAAADLPQRGGRGCD